MISKNQKDNLCRWDGVRLGWYEVWFFTLNHLASGCGFWFRYTIEAPVNPTKLPEADVWGFFFDPSHPSNNFGVKMTYPIDYFEWGKGNDFLVKIGNNFLGSKRAKGDLSDASHRVTWDLAFRSESETYYHIPGLIRKLHPTKTTVCSPNLNLRLNGQITIDGQNFYLQNDPGCQSHLWGQKHAEAWAWIHCNAFGSKSEALLEGIAARTKLTKHISTPLFSSLYLKYQGDEYRFSGFRIENDIQPGKPGEPGHWQFGARGLTTRLIGTAQCSNDKMLQVVYTDPDSDKVYCANSEVADLELRLDYRSMFGKWKPLANLCAKGTAHLEFGSRTPLFSSPPLFC